MKEIKQIKNYNFNGTCSKKFGYYCRSDDPNIFIRKKSNINNIDNQNDNETIYCSRRINNPNYNNNAQFEKNQNLYRIKYTDHNYDERYGNYCFVKKYNKNTNKFEYENVTICTKEELLKKYGMKEETNEISKQISNTKLIVNDDLIKLITSQDIIEGSWDENEETKKLINIISEDKFEFIKNKIYELNKAINQNKIIYTILVIYCLNTIYKEKLNENILVINKAKKFLNNGVNYEVIIKGIEKNIKILNTIYKRIKYLLNLILNIYFKNNLFFKVFYLC